eukprot:353588-Chlamydomonas_euryale.AAC.16
MRAPADCLMPDQQAELPHGGPVRRERGAAPRPGAVGRRQGRHPRPACAARGTRVAAALPQRAARASGRRPGGGAAQAAHGDEVQGKVPRAGGAAAGAVARAAAAGGAVRGGDQEWKPGRGPARGSAHEAHRIP